MKKTRLALLMLTLGLILAIALLALPAIGQSGDYGVATGAGGCGQTHYCTPTPQGDYTPEPTFTMQPLSVNSG